MVSGFLEEKGWGRVEDGGEEEKKVVKSMSGDILYCYTAPSFGNKKIVESLEKKG